MVKPFTQPIYVTRPILPDLATVTERLRPVWEAAWLTNTGAQHRALEARLRERLAVPHLALFNNGTSALTAALMGVGVAGEVITTPFTFPATPHAIRMAGATPVFCDIDDRTLNLDPQAIRRLITPRTTAIVPVHVFGRACDVARIQSIAREYGLRVVYDAAHAFGGSVGGQSIGSFGDATMFSFHATKMFHTVEGGGVATARGDLHAALDRLRNFGIDETGDVEAVGMNGKLNEVQAAIGLATLELVDDELMNRRRIVAIYTRLLACVPGVSIVTPGWPDQPTAAYFVIRIDAARFGMDRDALYEHLLTYNVVSRKYFSPLCSNLTAYRDLPSSAPSALPIANRVAGQVLALPLYGALPPTAAQAIAEIIRLASRRPARATRLAAPTAAPPTVRHPRLTDGRVARSVPA